MSGAHRYSLTARARKNETNRDTELFQHPDTKIVPPEIPECRISRGHSLFLLKVQAVEALPRINEIEAFDQDLLVLEPVQRIPDCTRGQGRLADEILLGQLPAVLQYFEHELRRRGQVPDASGEIIAVCGYNKNDPS